MKALFLVSNYTEDGETIVLRDLLLRSKFKVDLVSITDSLDLETAYGLKYKADYLLSEVDIKKYDFLYVSGGKYVSMVIDGKDYEKLENINKVITYFHEKNKLIIAICAAPRFLGRLGLLDNIDFTCYPGCEHEMKGNYLRNQKVVVTEKIITARSIYSVFDLGYEVVKKLYGNDMANNLNLQLVVD